MAINGFQDFVNALLECGFSMGGGNSEGIYSVSKDFGSSIVSHTGDPETDPWEWRMRVLEERSDIANAKVFFRKSGWMTREWAPFFLAVRRGAKTLEQAYADGCVSLSAKRIYDTITKVGTFEPDGGMAVHVIKRLGGFSQEENAKFERGLNELQSKMYVTMCGQQLKISNQGKEYGWSSTVFCTVERFWGEDVFKEAAGYDAAFAYDRIEEQIYRLNPQAEAKKIPRFIKG